MNKENENQLQLNNDEQINIENNNENNNNNNNENENNDELTEDNEEKENDEIKIDYSKEPLIKEFKDFLEKTYKIFQQLFLIHNKDEFIQKMNEIGKKPTIKERKKTRKLTRKQAKEMKERNDNKMREIEFDKNDIEDERLRTFYKYEKRKNNAPSSDIFQRFMEEQQEKIREFVYKPETKKNKP